MTNGWAISYCTIVVYTINPDGYIEPVMIRTYIMTKSSRTKCNPDHHTEVGFMLVRQPTSFPVFSPEIERDPGRLQINNLREGQLSVKLSFIPGLSGDNIKLNCPSLELFICIPPDSGTHMTRPNQGLSPSQERTLGTRLVRQPEACIWAPNNCASRLHRMVSIWYLLLRAKWVTSYSEHSVIFGSSPYRIDANSPAFGGRLTLFCLFSRSPALVLKSPAFHVD